MIISRIQRLLKESPGRAIKSKLVKQSDKDYYELESLEIDNVDYTENAPRRFKVTGDFDCFVKRNNLTRNEYFEIQKASINKRYEAVFLIKNKKTLKTLRI